MVLNLQGGGSRGGAHRCAGFDVDVHEQTPERTEVGGNITGSQCRAHLVAHILYSLELTDGSTRGGSPRRLQQRRWRDGLTLRRAQLNPLCKELYGVPQLTMHRADLLAVIAFSASTIRSCAVVPRSTRTAAIFLRGGQRPRAV
jgi:hypothetical protein